MTLPNIDIEGWLDEKEKRDLDDRSRGIVEKIEEQVADSGIKKQRIYERSQEIPHDSYFEYLVDRKLEGKGEPTAQEVWEYMKKITNRLSGELGKASEEYTKKENEVRHLKNDINEMLKEKQG